MAEYTAEDFKNARFAEHENGRAAMRPQPGRLWHLGSVHMGDYDMAENGWRPVVEADHPVRPLAGYRAQVKELREDNEALRGRVEGLMHQLSAGERTVAALRALAPLTLDTLREAWENAEQSGECREGDTLMTRHSDDNYEVWVSVGAFDIGEKSRVLRRVPQPEPWADLADVLAVEMPGIEDEPRIEALAKALHCEHGVRVTGGEEA